MLTKISFKSNILFIYVGPEIWVFLTTHYVKTKQKVSYPVQIDGIFVHVASFFGQI